MRRAVLGARDSMSGVRSFDSNSGDSRQDGGIQPGIGQNLGDLRAECGRGRRAKEVEPDQRETADPAAKMSDVTRILDATGQGDRHAASELLPLVYEELRKLAAARMAQEQPGQTLQPTALVHEAWLRLTANTEMRWSSRGHFFGAAAEAMRRILI